MKGLAEAEPDLIALQEVNLRVNTAAWLSEQLNYAHRFLTPKTGGEGKKEGIAILSRLPFLQQESLDLLTQQRVAQCVRVDVGNGHQLVLANGHFYWQPGDSSERLRQVERLLAWLKPLSLGQPVVVCGDFNSTPNTAAIQRMRQDYVSAYAARLGREPEYTFPTPLPRSKLALLRTVLRYWRDIRLLELRLEFRGTLDYIFVDRRLRVLDCRVVLDQPAPGQPRLYPSDHFGLCAELKFDD